MEEEPAAAMARTCRASFKIDMGERLCYMEGAGVLFSCFRARNGGKPRIV